MILTWASVIVIFWFLLPPMASAPVAFLLGVFAFTLTKPLYARCDPSPNKVAQLITIGYYGANPDDPLFEGLPETVQDGIGT